MKYKDEREAPTQEPKTEPETVDEAIAVLPKASDVYGGDDFSGAKNSAVVNPAPGVWYVLPRSKPARCYEKIARQLINPLEPEAESSAWRGLARLARILRLRPDELDVEALVS